MIGYLSLKQFHSIAIGQSVRSCQMGIYIQLMFPAQTSPVLPFYQTSNQAPLFRISQRDRIESKHLQRAPIDYMESYKRQRSWSAWVGGCRSNVEHKFLYLGYFTMQERMLSSGGRYEREIFPFDSGGEEGEIDKWINKQIRIWNLLITLIFNFGLCKIDRLVIDTK